MKREIGITIAWIMAAGCAGVTNGPEQAAEPAQLIALADRARDGTLPIGEQATYLSLQARHPAYLVFDPQAADSPEATSFLGLPLERPALGGESLAELNENLQVAWDAYIAEPTSEEAAIWTGRRLAYLGRYREAVGVYTRALALHPDSYKLLRHRGHRQITLRRPDRAVEDLRRAGELARGIPDELEPDGAPNRFGIPTSSNQSNIYYHLGLAHYLRGEFDPALAAYRRCMEFASTDDMRVATAYWTVMTLQRLGRGEEAAPLLAWVTPELEVLENTAYKACMLHFKGILSAEEVLEGIEPGSLQYATRGFGLGNKLLWDGKSEAARETFEQIAAGAFWPAFGHIAAEAELWRGR